MDVNDGSTSRRTLVSGSLMSRSTMTSTTSMSANNASSNPMIIANRYFVGKKIGFGNFGEVRFGKSIHSGECVAIKLESMKTRIPQLKGEHQFYLLLGRAEGIPNVYYYGPFSSHNALVMEFLGPNLEQLFMKYNRKFVYKTVLLTAMQLLRRFEYIHSKGIIFRDVKPENFVIGNANNDGIIYVIDFGLAKAYINLETKQHIPFCCNKNLSGTARYMSVNTHLGCEQSRRDDLESLGYMLIYFLRGALPWQGLKADNIFERYKKIGQVKKDTSVETLCYNLASEWSEYMNYVKELRFDQKPDYDFLYNIFFNACKRNGFAVDQQFEWSDQDYSQPTTASNRYSFRNKSMLDPLLTTPFNLQGDSLLSHNSYNRTKNYNYKTNPILQEVGDYNDVFDTNNYSKSVSNGSTGGGDDTLMSANRITSTVLNDMRNNQENRVERFKSHSRKPTPSHFCNDRKKKHSRISQPSPDIPDQNTLTTECNGSTYGLFDNFKISIWSCCYKFRRSNRINDSFE